MIWTGEFDEAERFCIRLVVFWAISGWLLSRINWLLDRISRRDWRAP